MAILLTGGAGYIGSHTCVEMLNAGYDVIVVDNLNNSSVESLNRVEKITRYLDEMAFSNYERTRFPQELEEEAAEILNACII